MYACIVDFHCEIIKAQVWTAFWLSDTFVWLLYLQPSISTPFQPAQPAQSSGAFGFSNFGQTQPGQFNILYNAYTICFVSCNDWKGVEMDSCSYKSQTKVLESQNAVQTWAFIISQGKSTIHAYIRQRKLENGQKDAKFEHKYPKVN